MGREAGQCCLLARARGFDSAIELLLERLFDDNRSLWLRGKPHTRDESKSWFDEARSCSLIAEVHELMK